MKTTLTIIKADIGAVGGHLKPSEAVLGRVKEYVQLEGGGKVIDSYVCYTGDDIAILMSHQRGSQDPEIHKLAWDAFHEATEIAKEEGLYGAGQDLLKDSFSGNVRGLGPAVAELEFEERPNEPFLLFAADKTEPGAYNLPLYLGFADPMYCPGLMLSPSMSKGFTFTIMDVSYTEGDRVIELNAPEDLYDLAALLRDNHRFVIESIRSRSTGEACVACSTTRLHNIAGKYVGKDDPVMIVRVQNQFPATGEVIAPFAIAHYVAGDLRGSHNVALMPIKINSPVAYFDGPALVSCLAFCVHKGRLTEPVDVFDHPFWDNIRAKASEKTLEIRRQGFSGPAMVGFEELEYGGITERLKRLDGKFTVRGPAETEDVSA
jgi:fructose 1,6-bisphosphate aldolase/phosphatase